MQEILSRYHNLQPCVTRTLLHAFLDPSKALPQHYSAIQGLASLGPNVVCLLVLPNLEPYLLLLEPEMQLEKQNNEMKRSEAWLVYGALMRATSLCMYGQLKMLPSLLVPPARAVWKSNGKIRMMSYKHKASIDSTMHQSPLKKLATESPMGPTPSNSLPVDMPGSSGGYPTISGTSDANLQSSRNENVPGSSGRKEMVGGQWSKTSASLDQAWKDDVDVGHLLPLLFEYFGGSMLSFVP